MLTMTATEVSRNFNRVLDSLENGENEVQIMRNNRPVAWLVSKPKQPRQMTSMEILESIHGSITEEEGEQWLKDIRDFDRPLAMELRDPWEE